MKKHNIEALFFDLDGTLVDSEPLYNRFWREGAKYFGYNMSFEQALELRSLDSNLAKKKFIEWFNNDELYENAKKIRKQKMHEYLLRNPLILKNGAIELLTYLKQSNIKSYVVTATAKADAIKMLSDLNILSYFEDVISTKEVKTGKPNPDVYLMALDIANLSADKVIAIEDSPNGIKSATRANIKTIYIPDLTSGDKELKEIKHISVESLDKIIELLDVTSLVDE